MENRNNLTFEIHELEIKISQLYKVIETRGRENWALQGKITGLQKILADNKIKRRRIKEKLRETANTVRLMKEKYRDQGSALNQKLDVPQRLPSDLTRAMDIAIKNLLDEKDEINRIRKEKIEFLQKEYRELEERSSSFSLDYIKSIFSNLLSNIPLQNPETEKIIELLMTILGFTTTEKRSISQIRSLPLSRRNLMNRIMF